MSLLARRVWGTSLIRRTVLPFGRGMEEFLPPPVDPKADKSGVHHTGRHWKASELRLKSFEDLQRLWFVLLKERDMLVSDRLFHKQANMAQPESYRQRQVKKSMAMIQVVLGERSRAFKAAKAAGADPITGRPLAGAAILGVPKNVIKE